ncbi:MAG: hypothetical protein H7Y16_08675 [Candidatus Parcubacteria bacterium]|nr:hypothetical protein [Burkholderiales bacterium]
MLGLSPAEFATLRRLRTPERIQAFLYGLKQNFERKGETCNSVRVVLRERRAHCIEGAVTAACALWIQGEPPLLLDFQAVHDFDHVVAVFRRNGRWGAISKTNGIGLRWRDPVYRTLRELAMSYLHEYYNKRDRKTLRTYSRPYDLRRTKPEIWVTAEDGAWELVDALEATQHYRLMTTRQARTLLRRDPFERKVGNLLQHSKPRKK